MFLVYLLFLVRITSCSFLATTFSASCSLLQNLIHEHLLCSSPLFAPTHLIKTIKILLTLPASENWLNYSLLLLYEHLLGFSILCPCTPIKTIKIWLTLPASENWLNYSLLFLYEHLLGFTFLKIALLMSMHLLQQINLLVYIYSPCCFSLAHFAPRQCSCLLAHLHCSLLAILLCS